MAAPRKTPQDHKEPAAEIREDAKAALESAPALSETPGHELLRPLSEIDGFEQTEILLAFEEEESDTRAIMSFARRVRDEYVIDKDAFDEFNRGPGAAGRLIKLVMAYVAEMGKGVL